LSGEIKIDGSHGEGGGQIIRTAVALSAITDRPVQVGNIRANRPKPGLANQHLTGLRAMQQICEAELEGDKLGSTAFTFRPRAIRHGEYAFEVGTAGSVTLVLQTILPALASLKGESTISIRGGTDVKWSPPVDYYRLVLFPLLRDCGLECTLEVVRRGYFPKGGGDILVHVKSFAEGLSEVEGPDDWNITGIVNITALDQRIAERVRRSVIEHLPSVINTDIEIEHREKGGSMGVGVVLAAGKGARILGASSLGERGKPAEQVGKEAAEALMAEVDNDAELDLHAADQILPFLLLSERSRSFKTRKVTGHIRTNIWTIHKFKPNIFSINEGACKITKL